MCGIAGYHIRRMSRVSFNPSALAAELLLGIEERGKDATGYVAVSADGSLQSQKAACAASVFVSACRSLPADTRTVLLHTRLATQGKAAFPENNHPVTSGGVHVVHNGHIYNDRALFGSLGVDRLGYVDSEVIPACLAVEGWDKPARALELLDGALAIAAINEHAPGELLLAKGEWSPLYVVASENLIVWASTKTAILRAWKRALGTEPRKERVRMMLAGEMWRIADGKMTPDSFTPIPQVIATGKQITTAASSACLVPQVKTTAEEWDSDDELRRKGYSAKLDRALRTLDERSRSTLKTAVWDTDSEEWSLADYIPAETDREVRCACCGDWSDVLAMRSFAAELVCFACYEQITDLR